ncbi:MAG TPA: hypothetical protein VFA79_06145 [Myxococcales bacterium]|nr:hypothetical protein [Myxococcales bacterium]
MRRILIAVFLAAGCIHGSPAVQRDDRALRAIAQQERWAQQALAARPTRAQLDAIRASDYAAVGRGRGDLKRLIQAIDRGTWIRNTAAEALAEGPDPELARAFDRAGRMRTEAVQAADELASALADAKGGLTIGDLRPGFDAVRKAQASEDRIARMPVRPGEPRLVPAPLPLPRPFIAGAARLVSANPELGRELDRLGPDEAAQIRARVGDVETAEQRPPEPPPATAAPPPARDEEVPPPGDAKEAEAPSPTLNIANDAAALLAKRAPRAITLREDGLFELSYDDANYLVDPQGKLIRKEPPSRR